MVNCFDCLFENHSKCSKGKIILNRDAEHNCELFVSYITPKREEIKRKFADAVRKFETGATRDTVEGKLDYEGFFSPVVLEIYAKYLHKHRIQSDGNLRDADNWQKMFGEKHFDVCMKSACRHFMDWWKQHRGFEGENTIEDSISALIFNAMAYLYKIEKDKKKETK